MTPMTDAEIDALNTAYENLMDSDQSLSSHIGIARTAARFGLEEVRRDDTSGALYRNAAGRYCYGWEGGGFDDQIGE